MGIESRCIEIVSAMLPNSSSNRYCLGFELDIVAEIGPNLVNLEIDGPAHREARQRNADALRDEFFGWLGIQVVRIDPYDAKGYERDDLTGIVAAALRTAGVHTAKHWRDRGGVSQRR